MTGGEVTTSLVSAAAFAAAAVGARRLLRGPDARAAAMVRIGAAVAMLSSSALLIRAFAAQGPVAALQQGYESMSLLAVLTGLLGVGLHVAGTLRGLDALLLGFAALMEAAAIVFGGDPPIQSIQRPWFISHGLAFALSGACFTAAGLAGAAYLLAYRGLRRRPVRRPSAVGASLESLERFGRTALVLGFPLFTYGILTGMCGIAHRRDLNFAGMLTDVTALLSLAAWGVYAYMLIFSLWRPSLRGPTAAALAAVGWVVVTTAFLARELMSPLHQ